jgi:hypothetical protein
MMFLFDVYFCPPTYSQKAKFQAFSSRLKFVEALHHSLMQYSKTKILSDDWLEIVSQNYLSHTGQRL